MTGSDVLILQNLLTRFLPQQVISGSYDVNTSKTINQLQLVSGLEPTGNCDKNTANLVLKNFSFDGYRDDGAPANLQGYMYKVSVAVCLNRSIESTADLYDGFGVKLFSFTVRAHGVNEDSPSVWPDYNDTSIGLNQFSSNGNTPTGLMTFDLNSPEDNPKLYGPYPVNRAVAGLKGNALFLLPHIRNGILMHTGDWPGWTETKPMPNSEGCIHSWPGNILNVSTILQNIGVEVRKNTNGQLPYPYKPQGLLSVEQRTDC